MLFVSSKPDCLTVMIPGPMSYQQSRTAKGQQGDCLPSVSLLVVSVPQVTKFVWFFVL